MTSRNAPLPPIYFAENIETPTLNRSTPDEDTYPALPARLNFSRTAKMAVPILDGLEMLNTEDIIKCISQDNCTEIVMCSGTRYRVSRVLRDYEHMLNGLNFFRIHNSCLINLRHVKKYIKGEGGFVLMSDGACCEVSRRKKAGLINRLALIPL